MVGCGDGWLEGIRLFGWGSERRKWWIERGRRETRWLRCRRVEGGGRAGKTQRREDEVTWTS